MPASLTQERENTSQRTWRLARQNTPKIRTADVWFLGAILPLVLLVFYGDFLRIPLKSCCPPTDYLTWKFPPFSCFRVAKNHQNSGIFSLPPGSPIFRQIPLSLEFPNSLKKRVRETGKVIVTVPGESLAQAVMACGSSTGDTSHKVEENHIEMTSVEGSDIQIPVDTRLAMIGTLQQSVEVGHHILHICQVDQSLGDEDKKGLYAWNGFGKVSPAVEG